MKIEKYVTNCHRKYYLKVHLIFACKYREKMLQNGIDIEIKNKFKDIANSYDFDIDIVNYTHLKDGCFLLHGQCLHNDFS